MNTSVSGWVLPLIFAELFVSGCRGALPQPAAHKLKVASETTASRTPSSHPFDLLRINDGEGIVFGDKIGSMVPWWTLKPKGFYPDQPLGRLQEGTRVTLVGEMPQPSQAGIEDGQDSFVTIEVAGQQGLLPEARLITSDRIRWSPDKQWGVFAANHSCHEYCLAEIWLLDRRAQRRRRLSTRAGFDPIVSWHPSGKFVAIGSRHLWVVNLSTLALEKDDPTVTSPAYGKDGKLYVRGNGPHAGKCDDAVYEINTRGKKQPLFVQQGCNHICKPGTDYGDPSAVEFEQGSTIKAQFFRGGSDLKMLNIEVFMTPEGKMLSRKTKDLQGSR